MAVSRKATTIGFARISAPSHSALASLAQAKEALHRSTYVRCSGLVAPRVLVIAEDLLASLDYGFTDSGFSTYLQALQRSVVLRLDELRAMVPALQWVLLERIAVLAKHALAKGYEWSASDCGGSAGHWRRVFEVFARSLRRLGRSCWSR